MPEFTAQELEYAANAALEYHWNTPEVIDQNRQEKPLLKWLMGSAETFPGGKDYITFRAKGMPDANLQGFQNDDSVGYSNPTNLKTGRVPWKLMHTGISFSMHELLKDGISITDSTDGSGERRHSKRDKTVLANMLQGKIEDMQESADKGHNLMLWRDGTQDSALVPGIRSFILDDPTSATVVEGIDQSANTWWRNRAALNLTATTASDQNVIIRLQREWRQLRRYGGRPGKVLAGSDFIEWIEKELRAKGNYTEKGWMSKEATDGGMADVSFKGVTFEYDPTLDDEGLAKYCYVLDPKTIKIMPIEGENGKDHKPARPENKYVFYRAKTWVYGLICKQRNANGVYSIA